MVITIALLAYSPSFIDTILQSGIFLESYYLFVKIGLFFIIASMLLTILYKVYKKEKIEINEIINNNRKVKKSINDKIKEIESKQYGVVLSLEESKKNYKQFIELIGYNYSYTYINEGKLEYPIIKNLIKVYNKLKFKKNLSYEEIKNYIEFYTSIDSNFQYYKLESKESDKEIETILIEGKCFDKNFFYLLFFNNSNFFSIFNIGDQIFQ